MDKEIREIMDYIDSMLDSMNSNFDHIDSMLDSIEGKMDSMTEKIAISNDILTSEYNSMIEKYGYNEETIKAKNEIEEMKKNVIPFKSYKNVDEIFEDILDE